MSKAGPSIFIVRLIKIYARRDSSCSTTFWKTLGRQTPSVGGQTGRQIYDGIVLIDAVDAIFKDLIVTTGAKLLSGSMLPHSLHKLGSDWTRLGWMHDNNPKLVVTAAFQSSIRFVQEQSEERMTLVICKLLAASHLEFEVEGRDQTRISGTRLLRWMES